ncbi:MAG TPA: hypothetical protein DEP66_05080, partial [Acidimicrobiaceae bacterium]|nr:hypothetical protein [Acidimicrobiaceae bacterium]
MQLGEIARIAGGGTTTVLGAPSAIIYDTSGSGGGVVCLFGTAAGSTTECATDAGNTGIAPLVEGETISVEAGAVIDAAGNESGPVLVDVGDVTRPIVRVVSENSNYRFVVSVTGGNTQVGRPSDAQVVIGDIRITRAAPTPGAGDDERFKSPSVIIPDGFGGGLVCLLGVLAANPGTCASTPFNANNLNAAAGVVLLAEGDTIRVVAGAVIDAAGNRSRASNEIVIGDVTAPVVTIHPLDDRDRLLEGVTSVTFEIEEDNLGTSGSGDPTIVLAELTLNDAPLTNTFANAVVVSPTAAGVFSPVVVCLHGTAANGRDCEDGDGLAARAKIGVVAGAITDPVGNPSRAVSRTAVDTNVPVVEIVLADGVSHQFTVVVIEDTGLSTTVAADAQVAIGEIHRRHGPAGTPADFADPSAVIADGSGGGLVCLFGLAAGSSTECATDVGNTGVVPLTENEELYVDARAVVDAEGNTSSPSNLVTVRDVTPPVVTVFLTPGLSHEFHVNVREPSDWAVPAVGDPILLTRIAIVRADGTSTTTLDSPAVAQVRSAVGVFQATYRICLFGVVGGTGADAAECSMTPGSGADAIARLAEGDMIIVDAGAVVNTGTQPSAAAGSDPVGDVTPPVVTITLEGTSGVGGGSDHSFRVVVEESSGFGTEGDAADRRVELDEIVRILPGGARAADLVPPSVILRTGADGTAENAGGLVCLFGESSPPTDPGTCRADDPNDDGVEPNRLRRGEQVYVAAEAVRNAGTQHSTESARADIPGVAPPVVKLRLAPGVRNAHEFFVTVTDDDGLAGGTDRVVDIDEIYHGPADGSSRRSFGSPSAFIRTGAVGTPAAAGGTLCLFGIDPATVSDPPADQECATRQGSTGVDPLVEGERIFIGGTVISDGFQTGNVPAQIIVGDLTPPTVVINTGETLSHSDLEEGAHELWFHVVELNPDRDIRESYETVGLSEFSLNNLFLTLRAPATTTQNYFAHGRTRFCLLGQVDLAGNNRNCVTPAADGSDDAFLLTGEDRITVNEGAARDVAGNPSTAAMFTVADGTLPVVAIEPAAEGDDQFKIRLTEALPSTVPADSQVDLADIRWTPLGGTELALPTRVALIQQYEGDVSDGRGGTTRHNVGAVVCLLGTTAGGLSCASNDGSSDAGLLQRGDQYTVREGAVTDRADNRSPVSNVFTVPDNTPPHLAILLLLDDAAFFTVAVTEPTPDPLARLTASEFTITRDGTTTRLGSPADTIDDLAADGSLNAVVVCLFGKTNSTTCVDTDPDTGTPPNRLRANDVVTVDAGALADGAAVPNLSEAESWSVDDTDPPVVTLANDTDNWQFTLTVTEKYFDPGSEIEHGDIRFDDGDLPAGSAVIAGAVDADTGVRVFTVCLFGEAGPATDPRTCRADDPDLATAPAVLVGGEAVALAAGVVEDSNENGNVPFDGAIADTYVPVVTITRPAEGSHQFVVSVDEAHPKGGELGKVIADDTSVMLADGSTFSPAGEIDGADGGTIVCLFGLAAGVCATTPTGGARTLRYNDEVSVNDGAVLDVAENPSARKSVIVRDTTAPTVAISRLEPGDGYFFEITVIEDNPGSDVLDRADIAFRGEPLPDAAKLIPPGGAGTGVVRVCLFGLSTNAPPHACRDDDPDTTDAYSTLRGLDSVTVRENAVTDASGNSSGGPVFLEIEDGEPPVVTVSLTAGESHQFVVTVVEIGSGLSDDADDGVVGLGEIQVAGRRLGPAGTDPAVIVRDGADGTPAAAGGTVCLFGITAPGSGTCIAADDDTTDAYGPLAEGDTIYVAAEAVVDKANNSSLQSESQTVGDVTAPTAGITRVPGESHRFTVTVTDAGGVAGSQPPAAGSLATTPEGGSETPFAAPTAAIDYGDNSYVVCVFGIDGTGAACHAEQQSSGPTARRLVEDDLLVVLAGAFTDDVGLPNPRSEHHSVGDVTAPAVTVTVPANADANYQLTVEVVESGGLAGGDDGQVSVGEITRAPDGGDEEFFTASSAMIPAADGSGGGTLCLFGTAAGNSTECARDPGTTGVAPLADGETVVVVVGAVHDLVGLPNPASPDATTGDVTRPVFVIVSGFVEGSFNFRFGLVDAGNLDEYGSGWRFPAVNQYTLNGGHLSGLQRFERGVGTIEVCLLGGRDSSFCLLDPPADSTVAPLAIGDTVVVNAGAVRDLAENQNLRASFTVADTSAPEVKIVLGPGEAHQFTVNVIETGTLSTDSERALVRVGEITRAGGSGPGQSAPVSFAAPSAVVRTGTAGTPEYAGGLLCLLGESVASAGTCATDPADTGDPTAAGAVALLTKDETITVGGDVVFNSADPEQGNTAASATVGDVTAPTVTVVLAEAVNHQFTVVVAEDDGLAGGDDAQVSVGEIVRALAGGNEEFFGASSAMIRTGTAGTPENAGGILCLFGTAAGNATECARDPGTTGVAPLVEDERIRVVPDAVRDAAGIGNAVSETQTVGDVTRPLVAIIFEPAVAHQFRITLEENVRLTDVYDTGREPDNRLHVFEIRRPDQPLRYSAIGTPSDLQLIGDDAETAGRISRVYLVCLYGAPVLDVCSDTRPANNVVPDLAEGERISVDGGAFVDAVGLRNLLVEALVGDLSPPVVSFELYPGDDHRIRVLVEESYPLSTVPAESRIDLADITRQAPGGSAARLASPSTVIPDGSGGATLCLFGVVDPGQQAGDQECVTAAGSTGVAPLSAGETFTVRTDAVFNAVGQPNAAVTSDAVGDVTAPRVAFTFEQATFAYQFGVVVDEASGEFGTGAGEGQVAIGQISRQIGSAAAAALASPSAMIPAADGSGGGTVCLWGETSPQVDPPTCVSTPVDGTPALASGQILQIARGAVVDAAGLPNPELTENVPDLATPVLRIGEPVVAGVHQFSVTVTDDVAPTGDYSVVSRLRENDALVLKFFVQRGGALSFFFGVEYPAVSVIADLAASTDAGRAVVCLYGNTGTACDTEVSPADSDPLEAGWTLGVSVGAYVDVDGNDSLSHNVTVATSAQAGWPTIAITGDGTEPVERSVAQGAQQFSLEISDNAALPSAAHVQITAAELRLVRAGDPVPPPVDLSSLFANLDVIADPDDPTNPNKAVVCLQEASGSVCDTVDSPAELLAEGDTIVVVARAVADADGNENVRATAVVGPPPPSPPGAPGRLSATAPTADGGLRIFLAWEPPADLGNPELTGYQHRRRRSTDTAAFDGEAGEALWSMPAPGLTAAYDFDDDLAGVAHVFEVRAVNAGGGGAPAATERAPVGLPGAPRPSDFDTSSDGLLTFNWRAPLDDGGSTVTGYEYRYAEGATVDDDVAWRQFEGTLPTGGGATSVRTEKVEGGVEYTAQVRAVNAVGFGPHAGRTVTQTTRAPDPPTGLTPTVADEAIGLEWVAPDSDNGNPITGYQVCSTPAADPCDDSGDWVGIPGSDAGTRSVDIEDLTNGEARFFRVRAVYQGLIAEASGEASDAVSATPVGPPSAPRDLAAERVVGGGAVALTWEAPASDGGSPVTGYEVCTKPDAADTCDDPADPADWVGIPGSVAGTRDYTVRPLENGEEFFFRVRAVNAAATGGAGAASNQADATPFTTPGAPRTLTTISNQPQILTLGWTEPADDGGSAVENYQFRSSAADDGFIDDWADIPNGDADTRDHDVTGLTDGVDVFFQVRAVNAAGVGDASATSAADSSVGAPGAPTNFDATPGDTEIVIDWNAPAVTGGRPLVYEYRSRKTSEAAFAGNAGWTQTNSLISHTLEGLDNGDEYQIELRACNTTFCNFDHVSASATPRLVPNAPQQLTASLAGTGQIRLNWLAPDNAATAAITGYDFRYKVDGGEYSVYADTGDDLVHLVPGLANGNSYEFQVRATASGQNGPHASVIVVPGVLPGAPASLTATATATAAGGGRVVLSWPAVGADDAGDPPFTRYEYRSRKATETTAFDGDAGEALWASIADLGVAPTATSATLVGHDAVEHVFAVRAVGVVGAGPAAEATATPNALSDDAALTSLTAAAVDGEVILLAVGTQAGTADDPVAYTADVSPLIQQFRITPTARHPYAVVTVGDGPYPVTTFAAVGVVVTAEDGITQRFHEVIVSAQTVPGRPDRGIQHSAGNRVANLSWLPPVDDGGTPVIAYEYRYSKQRQIPGSVAWIRLLVGDIVFDQGRVTVVVEDLDNGTSYFFEARAVNAIGAGPSTPRQVLLAAGEPSEPTGLTADAGSAAGSVQLGWNAPADGGSAILHYQYQQSDTTGVFPADDDAWMTIPPGAGVPAPEVLLTGLPGGTELSFRVRAVNEHDAGRASAVAAATPPTVPPSAPVLSGSSTASETVDLAWDAPASDGATPITLYQVCPAAGCAAADWEDIPGGAAARAHTVTSLPNGTRAAFRVRAVNAAGNGAASNLVHVTPFGPPDAVAGLTASGAVDDVTPTITPAWEAPSFDGGAPVLGYRVSRKEGDGAYSVLAAAVAPDVTSYDDSGNLSDVGTAFTYRVVAYNRIGDSEPADVPAGLQARPFDFTLVPGDGQVTLSWSAPPAITGVPNRGYEYITRVGSSGAFAIWMFTTDRRVVVDGLTNGRNHYFAVRAVNETGPGAPTITQRADPVAADTAPGKPTLTAMPSVGGRSVDLVWTVPDDGGATISGYEVRWREERHAFTSDEDAWARVSDRTTHTVTSLTAGVVHVFQVRALNSVGSGEASDEQSATPLTRDNVSPVVHIRSGAASGVDVGVSRPPTAGEHRLILIVTDDRALSADLSALAQIDLAVFELYLERPLVPPATRVRSLFLPDDVFPAAVLVDNPDPDAEGEAFVCFYGRNSDSGAADPCSATVPAGDTPTAAGDAFVVSGGAVLDANRNGNADAEVVVAPDPDALPSNTAPEITTSATLFVDEGGRALLVEAFAATDAENDGLTWSKTGGADIDRLGITPSGMLSFEDIPDFEDPDDADRNNVYEITVTVTDDGNPPLSADLEVSVTVRNVDEDGTVTITPSTAPRVGDTLTASVADPDGSAADPTADGPAAADTTWQWERSTNATDYTPISGATDAAYTVTSFDAGKTLRATAAYTDGHAADKTATSAATATVPVPAVFSVVGEPVFTGETTSGLNTYLNEGDTLVLTVSAEQEPAAESLVDAVTIFNEVPPLVTLDLVAGAGNTYTATYTVAAGHNVGSGDLSLGIDGVRDTDGNQFARFFRSFPGVVVDNRAPVIELLGDATVTVAFGGTYTELADPVSFPSSLPTPVRVVTFDGATVADVDTGTAGTYIITYTVTDPAGNAASDSRTVIVEAVQVAADARLSALSTAPATLNPPFDSDVYAYTADVPSSTTLVNVALAAVEANAFVEVTYGDDIPARQSGDFYRVTLRSDRTVIKIQVFSDVDNEVENTYTVTVTRVAPPGSPGIVFAVVAGQTVTVNWTPPTTGGAVSYYEWQRNIDFNVWTRVAGDGTVRSVVLENVEPGSHIFLVRAVNVLGVAGTRTVAPGVEVLNPAVPDSPVVSLTEAGDAELTFEWDEPASNGATITGYQVRWRRTDNTSGTWLRDYPEGTATDRLISSSRNWTARELTNGVSYTIQVRVLTDNADIHPDSNEVEGTPQETDRTAPIVLIRSGAASGVDVSVSRPPIAGEHRLILIITDDRELSDDLSALTQIDLSNLELSLTRPPVPPARAMDQYLSLDVFLAAVLVDNPDVEAEAFVCFYGLNSDSNAADPCSATVPAGDTPTAAGDVFGVYSSAVEDANENVNADTAVTVVPVAAAPTTAPGKPTLTATPGIGGRTVDLVWTVPDDDGGAPISGYQFRWRLARHMFTSDEDAWATIRGSNAGTTTHTVTGLTAGVVHVFQVRARNSVGAGAASDEQSATPTAADSVNPVVHIRSGAASGVDVSVSRPPIAGEHRLILIVTDDRALSDDLSALAQIVLTDFELSLERPPVPPARAEPLYLSLDVFSAAVVVDNPAVEAEAFVCFYGRNADASAADPCSETVPAGNIPTAAGDVFSVFGGAAKDAANRDSGDAEVTVAPDPDAPPSNTAPVITTSAALSVAEGGSGVSVATFAADDADNDVLVWTTTGGADTAQLGVSPSGLLSFADIPDFENPRDTGSDNVYEITVTVTDDGTPPASATLDVSVTVSNVEEAGTVTIAPSTAPRVGDTLTASVADPDGSITGTTWQWASSTNATDYAPVSGATAAAYTPAPGDAGKTLRATAAYTDGH